MTTDFDDKDGWNKTEILEYNLNGLREIRVSFRSRPIKEKEKWIIKMF
jgi:hypothetical protein